MVAFTVVAFSTPAHVGCTLGASELLEAMIDAVRGEPAKEQEESGRCLPD